MGAAHETEKIGRLRRKIIRLESMNIDKKAPKNEIAYLTGVAPRLNLKSGWASKRTLTFSSQILWSAKVEIRNNKTEKEYSCHTLGVVVQTVETPMLAIHFFSVRTAKQFHVETVLPL